jgi:hypothetical protein
MESGETNNRSILRDPAGVERLPFHTLHTFLTLLTLFVPPHTQPHTKSQSPSAPSSPFKSSEPSRPRCLLFLPRHHSKIRRDICDVPVQIQSPENRKIGDSHLLFQADIHPLSLSIPFRRSSWILVIPTHPVNPVQVISRCQSLFSHSFPTSFFASKQIPVPYLLELPALTIPPIRIFDFLPESFFPLPFSIYQRQETRDE